MPTIGNFPLQYSGVNAVNPRNVYTYLRPPTQFDNQNFVIGDTWIHQINTGTPTQPNYTTTYPKPNTTTQCRPQPPPPNNPDKPNKQPKPPTPETKRS